MSALPVTHAKRYIAIDSVHNVAMQAQYLCLGHGVIFSELQEQEGHTAVTYRLSELAMIVHDFLQEDPKMKELALDAGWPGVFEYEVTEGLGTWFANHSLCSDDEFLEELKRVTEAWLA